MALLTGLLTAVLTVVLLVVGLLLPPSATAGTTPPPAPGPGAGSAGADEPVVVLIGVTGLQWADVRTLSTPNLWDLSRGAAVGTVAARSAHGTSCPADGWLAVSAGSRLADVEVEDGTCRTLRPVHEGRVPGWTDYLAAAQEQPYDADPGLLGALLAEQGVPVTGIGPGAAIALADPEGHPVGTHVRRPGTAAELDREVRAALTTSRLVVVDGGVVREAGHATVGRADAVGEPAVEQEPEQPEEVPLPGTEPDSGPPSAVDAIVEPTRAEQVREVDDRVGAVLRATRGRAVTLYVVSLADSGRAALQLAAATGPAPGGGEYDRALLTSGSTRQDAVVQTTDVTSTLLAALGVEDVPDSFVGAPIVPTAGPGSATARVELMHDITVEARQILRVSGPYLTRLVMAQVLLFAAGAVLLTRRGRADGTLMGGSLRVLRVVAIALGAAPIASFMADLVPWWHASAPVTAFWVTLLGWMVVVTAVALLGPWRRSLLGPPAVVAAVTVLVLVLDALVGSPLVIDSPMGAHRIMAARFYGVSNQAFALLAAAGPLLATAIAQPLVDAGRRRVATWVVVAVGLVITVVDGAPGLGSDFGGPPALIVGFAVLALVVSGRRVQWRALLLVVVVGAVVVVGFAALDWLRPAGDRTHLGRFFATVIDGGLWDVVARKLEVHLRVLTYWRYLVLALGGAVVTALVLVGPRPGTGLLGSRSPLAGLSRAVPLLRAGMAAVGIALVIGFLINDSGIIVPATGMAFAVPVVIAAAAQHRLANPEADLSPDDPAVTRRPAPHPAPDGR